MCILIGLQHQSKKYFPPIHIPKSLLENSSCGPNSAIYGSRQPRKYAGRPNIFDALDLMKLYIMDPLDLSRALFTVVANDASNLSMANASWGVYFSPLSLLFPSITNFGAILTPVPTTIVLSWDVMSFYGIGDTQFKKV